jgi:hypothetical protein
VFILLPTRHSATSRRSLNVGWAVSSHRGVPQAAICAAAALAVTVLPSFFLVGGLAKVSPPVAALEWVRESRTAAILYSDSLRRHGFILARRRV